MKTRGCIRARFAAFIVGPGVLLIHGVFLSGCKALDAANIEDHGIVFDQHEVVIGAAKRQTVLSGFLLGGDFAELAVVNNDERRLRIYALSDGTWEPMLDETLRAEVLFVDLANIGGRDRLLTYEHGRLNWFDPESATEHALVDMTTNFNAGDDGEIPHVDITRDVNRDGRDDLVVPDIDGFWISIQMSDGSFTDAVRLGPSEPFLDEAGLDDSGTNNSLTYGDVGITAFTLPLYLSRVHAMDYDHDGRSDVVFWNGDHFEVHHQDARGLFSSAAKTFTTDVPFDSDGVYSHAFEFSDVGAFGLLFGFRERTTRTMLHSFRDMNGDTVADLVTLTLAGRSPMKRRSVYEIHFGTPTPDGIQFAREASTAIQPRGKAGGGQPWGYASRRFEDFDGDGQIDIMLRDINIGLGGMFRALAANSIGVDVEFYRMDGGTYPDKPSFAREIRTAADLAHRKDPFFPAVLVGDVTGDGRADLLAGGKKREELDVFVGVPGPNLFSRRPQKVAVEMPGDGEYAHLVDLNKDGKQDILIHHPSTTEPHRVTLLITR